MWCSPLSLQHYSKILVVQVPQTHLVHRLISILTFHYHVVAHFRRLLDPPQNCVGTLAIPTFFSQQQRADMIGAAKAANIHGSLLHDTTARFLLLLLLKAVIWHLLVFS